MSDPRPRRWGLGTRLTLAVVALLVPLQAIVLFTYARNTGERRAAEVENAAAVAQAMATTVDAFARDLENTTLAAAIALGRQVGALDQTTVGSFLRALSDEYGVLRGLFLTDVQGRVVASASGAGVGLDLAQRPYMQSLRGGAATVWGPGVRGVESGEITVTFGRAVRGPDGAPRAYLVAAFYPPALVDRLNLDLAPDSDVTLIDGEGLILHSTARPDLPIGRRDASQSPLFRAAATGPAVRLDGPTSLFGGETRYGALVPVPRTGWVVVFSRPLAPLDARMQAQFLQQGGGIALVVLLAAAGLAALARRLLRPLAAMSAVAAAIARGERPAVPPLAADRDVEQLAAGMRAMAGAIAAREDDLRFLADASTTLAASLDYGATLASVARLAVPRLAGWCAVYAIEDDGSMRRLAGAHADPDKDALMHELIAHYALNPDPDHPVRRAIRTGQTVVPPPVLADQVDRYATDAEHGRILRALGTTSAVVVPLVAAGRAIGAISFGPAEQVDRALAEEMARRAAVAVDNARLYRDAQEAVRARDTFLSIAAHELKTPLTTVTGSAQLLARTRARGQLTDERLERLARAISSGAARLASLVDDLLDVSRIRTGQLALRTGPVDLMAVVDTAVERLRGRLDDAHTIVVDPWPHACTVEGDADRLAQVVENLLDNAVKYSPDGGTVRVGLAVDAGDLLLSVGDEGIGLPPGAAERIFEPFGRADNAAAASIPGMGLGLHICRVIVERHGGRVWAESPGEGRGTIIRVALPCTPVAAGAGGAGRA